MPRRATVTLEVLYSDHHMGMCAVECPWLAESDHAMDTYPECKLFGQLDGRFDNPLRHHLCKVNAKG